MNLELELLTKKVVVFQIEKPSEKNPLFVEYNPNVSVTSVLGAIYVPTVVAGQIERAPMGGSIVWENEKMNHTLELLYFNWENKRLFDSFVNDLLKKIQNILNKEKFESGSDVLWVFVPKVVSLAVIALFGPDNPENVILYRSTVTPITPYLLTYQEVLLEGKGLQPSFVCYPAKSITEI